MTNVILFLLVLSPATSFHYPLSSKISLQRRHFGYPTTQSHLSLLSSLDDSDRISPSNQSNNDDKPTIIFPGGGLFFYWQAGVVAYLQENNYNLSSNNILLCGASAGALSATLAKTNVNPYDATELALQMSDDNNIWERPLGLQGVWGSIIYDWLDELLPDDADLLVQEELHILLTPVPSFGKSIISSFDSREDLIQANMASVHLPWFLDGNLTSNYRGKPHIDGSFLAQPSDYLPVSSLSQRQDTSQQTNKPLILDYNSDPAMEGRASEFIKVGSKQAIWDILEQGKRSAKVMEEKGDFDILPRD